jgi:hypothetical protein
MSVLTTTTPTTKPSTPPGVCPTPPNELDYKLVDTWYQVVDGFIGLPRIHWLVLEHAERSVNIHARGYGIEGAVIRIRVFTIWRLCVVPSWDCKTAAPTGRDIKM